MNSKLLNISILHLEIIYFLKYCFNEQQNIIECKKFRLNGGNNYQLKRHNLVIILKNASPLFFSKYSDYEIKKCILEIIWTIHKNNKKNNKIFKYSRNKIQELIELNKIRI